MDSECPIRRGFHVMDEEEARQLKFLGNGEGICLSDPEPAYAGIHRLEADRGHCFPANWDKGYGKG